MSRTLDEISANAIVSGPNIFTQTAYFGHETYSLPVEPLEQEQAGGIDFTNSNFANHETDYKPCIPIEDLIKDSGFQIRNHPVKRIFDILRERFARRYKTEEVATTVYNYFNGNDISEEGKVVGQISIFDCTYEISIFNLVTTKELTYKSSGEETFTEDNNAPIGTNTPAPYDIAELDGNGEKNVHRFQLRFVKKTDSS